MVLDVLVLIGMLAGIVSVHIVNGIQTRHNPAWIGTWIPIFPVVGATFVATALAAINLRSKFRVAVFIVLLSMSLYILTAAWVGNLTSL